MDLAPTRHPATQVQVVIVIVHGVIIVLLVMLNFKYKMVIKVVVVLTKETTVLITINGSCIFFANQLN